MHGALVGLLSHWWDYRSHWWDYRSHWRDYRSHWWDYRSHWWDYRSHWWDFRKGRWYQHMIPRHAATPHHTSATISRASQRYATRLAAMLAFAGRQAGGNATGAHAAFKHIMVDAATLRLSQVVSDSVLLSQVVVSGCTAEPGSDE